MIKRTTSLTSRLMGLPDIDPGIQRGQWSKIGNGAKIGAGSHLGPWTEIGAGAVIGRDVKFGNWTKIGEGAHVGDGVVFGSHTRVQPGAIIPDFAILEDGDLVTKNGIIPNRSSGKVSHIEGDHYVVSGAFGRFRIPKDYTPTIHIPWDQKDEEDLFLGAGGSAGYEDARALDYLGKLMDAYMSGLTDEVEQFRVGPALGETHLLSIEDRTPVPDESEMTGFRI